MGRLVRDARFETREARLRLKARHEPYWRLIHQGLHLGLRKGPRGGVWWIRIYSGTRYLKRVLGSADDDRDADGQQVLSFRQAQKKVLDLAKTDEGTAVSPAPLLTVAQAAERYIDWFRQNRKSVRETENAVEAHILPALGGGLVAQLTASQIHEWLEELAAKPARVRTSRLEAELKYRVAPKTEDEKRARRATANRILAVLKAVLNKAFHDGLVSDDTPWRRIKPFPKVDEARVRFLTDAEAARLVNASPPDFCRLVQGALLTGARYGELVALKVHDVNLETAQIYIAHSKSGRPRYIPLNSRGVALFRAAAAGRTREDVLLVKRDGQPWGKNHHIRLLAEACKSAKIRPQISFHELRHTYASHLAQAGVDLLTISKLLGHTDTRITSRHYAHLSDKTLAHAVTKLPNFGAAQESKPHAIRMRRKTVRDPPRSPTRRADS